MNLLSDILAFTARQIGLLKNNLSGVTTRVGTAESNITGVTTRVNNIVATNTNSAETLYNNPNGFLDGTITLSKSIDNFDFIDIFFADGGAGNLRGGHSERIPAVAGTYTLKTWDATPASADFEAAIDYSEQSITISGTTFTAARNTAIGFSIASQSSSVTNYGSYIYQIVKIVGIKMGDASPAELTDVRVGEDNTQYPSAGEAVRRQFADVKSVSNGSAELQAHKYSGSWSIGGLSNADETTATNRIRTTYIPFNVLCKITISVESGYQYSISYFDSIKNFERVTQAWITTETEIDGVNAEYIRIVMRNENDTTMSVSDASNINISITSPLVGKVESLDDITEALSYDGYIDYPFEYVSGGYIDTTDGTVVANNNWKYTDYLPIDISTNGKIKPTIDVLNDGDFYNCFYDGAKSYLGPFRITDNEISIPDTAKYVRMSCRNAYTQTLGVYAYGALKIVDGVKAFASIDALRFGGYYDLPIEWFSNGYINTDGSLVPYNNWKYTDYIDVRNASNGILRATVSDPTIANNAYNAWYDSSKAFIGRLQMVTGDIEVPSNAAYVRLSCRNANAYTLQLYAYGTSAIKPNSGSSSASDKEYFMFATWNVGIFSDGTHQATAEAAPEQIAKLKKAIGKMDVDVINTQEFTDYIDSSQSYPTSDLLAYKYANKLYRKGSKSFSKLSTSNMEIITFTSGSDRACFAYTIEFNEKLITIINAHLSIELDPTVYREADIQQLISYMNTKEYVILSGDFNASGDAEFDAFKTAGYTLCNGGEFGWFDTWPVFDNMPTGWSTGWPCYHLDNIIVSSNIVPQYVEAFKCDISDHAPLIAEFKIN